MPTLSPLAAPQIVFMTNCGSVNDGKVDVVVTLVFSGISTYINIGAVCETSGPDARIHRTAPLAARETREPDAAHWTDGKNHT